MFRRKQGALPVGVGFLDLQFARYQMGTDRREAEEHYRLRLITREDISPPYFQLQTTMAQPMSIPAFSLNT